jgi:hypothetical protein
VTPTSIFQGGAVYNGFSWVAKASSAYVIGGDASRIRFFQNSGLTPGSLFTSTLMFKIDPLGRVGVGTASPTEKLHVAGNVKAQGFITGDVTFANGLRATEEGDGLAFLNPKGGKIAVLDGQGNLHIKGGSSNTSNRRIANVKGGEATDAGGENV